jgi:uncharacterized protein (TIGR02594 family)
MEPISTPDFAPWLRIAHRYDGLRELLDDGQLSPTVRDFFRATKYPRELVTTKTPWCAAFACPVFEICGVPHPHSARARDFLKSPHFVALRAPVLGSLLVFERHQPGTLASDTYGHVGFCARALVSPHQLEVQCFGGNQDNAACARRKKLEHLIASLWPKGHPLPPDAVLA